ncbi:MAG TPA: hypothetical protein VEJ44_03555 [Acidimicrobiales bacterium]|nr:hypothetical protein [Acidimicrobiales bacterium]
MLPAALVGMTVVTTGTALFGVPSATPAGAVPPSPQVAVPVQFEWQQLLPDNGGPVAESSPTEATLDGGGPSVVVGDRSGNVWAFHLSNGSPVAGWPAHTGGAPVDSTPSAVPNGSGTDDVYVGAGNAAQSTVGGYYAFANNGSQLWYRGAPDANGAHGVQASMAAGSLDGVTAVVAPSLGQEQYAFNAQTGAILPGWPFFTADSSFSTPAIADLYGNGQNDVVEGGDSSPGIAYGVTYPAGGHLRVIGQSGNLVCDHDFDQTVESSPAVGNFLAGGGLGIVVGTGTYYAGASDTNMVYATDASCNVVWGANLGATTTSSPAIADIEGNGTEQVVEATSNSVWALNGANGTAVPGWPQAVTGQAIGSVATADLTGLGYNDVLVPTTDGLDIFDGRSAQLVEVLGEGSLALQNAPLVTTDPNGTVGITIAGYNGDQQGVIQHYEVSGSAGRSLGLRSWPMFHQNPQLTGLLNAPPPGHLNAPIVGMAQTNDGRGYWNVASDGGLFAFGDAAFHGSMGGQHLNQPIVGMAPTPDGGGYWEVASDGGLFAFGDAGFYGSTGNLVLNRPVVGMAATPDGRGYWLVASDGGLFAFGDAAFYGSMGGSHLNRPVVGMASNPNGGGYWEVASDGGIFSFGAAPFYGSTGNIVLNQPVVGMATTHDGRGYWFVAADGGMFAFGDAGFYGSMPQVFAEQIGYD